MIPWPPWLRKLLRIARIRMFYRSNAIPDVPEQTKLAIRAALAAQWARLQYTI